MSLEKEVGWLHWDTVQSGSRALHAADLYTMVDCESFYSLGDIYLISKALVKEVLLSDDEKPGQIVSFWFFCGSFSNAHSKEGPF